MTESRCDPARLAVLNDSGLSDSADPSMDRFAAMVQAQLDVPMALVSLVEGDHQFFPGMRGLPQPWAAARRTPLSHSFCLHVVASGEPLVVVDARTDPRLHDSLAFPEVGIVAYAGSPLTDIEGRVLGSLCAIDTTARQWTEVELAALSDLAAACSTELRLRVAVRHAETERRRGRELGALVKVAFDRSQLLLTAARALNSATNVVEIRHEVSDLVSGDLKPRYVGLVVIEDGHLRHVVDPQDPAAFDDVENYLLDALQPTAQAVRERRMLCYPDRASLAAAFPPRITQAFEDLDLHAVVYAPLMGAREVLGVLVFGWDAPHPTDDAERAIITTIGAYTAQALERARYVELRVSVARQMQEALLTALPEVDGLALAARYLPAAAEEAVGGDWYDAVLAPHPGLVGDRVLAVTVGDITGHDVHAITMMAQVRSMMRQAAWCHPGMRPAAVVQELENALAGLPVAAHGTLLHGHLSPHDDGSGCWTLCYTNAGHPPPILILPGGATTVLDEHDMMFGFPDLRRDPRVDHVVVIEPGTTVFLYTDGLIERRGIDLDDGIAELRALLGTLHTRPPRRIVDIAVSTLLAPRHADDVVAFAITIPALVQRQGSDPGQEISAHTVLPSVRGTTPH